MTACPPAEQLSALLFGTIAEADLPTLETHLADCPACRDRLDELTTSPGLAAWLGPRPAAPPEFPFLDPSDRPGCVGRVGRFHIEAEVGRGGMGVVFRSWDSELNRPVALKVLRAGRADPVGVARFAREARAAAGVRHDHLLPVLDVCRTADGRAVLVLPFVHGPSLRDRLRAGPELAPREAAEIVRQVAAGLGHAHAAGLVHRDVKSANILLDRADGRAKLTDFGLARPVASGETLTQDGAVAGTPEYLAPEQAADARRAGPPADVYGLGVTLYECLTGVVPFRGTLPELLDRHRTEEPVPPRRLTARVPADLETVALKCLEKDPARRYPTAAELEADLARFLAGRPVRARPLGPVGRGRRWARRNPLPVAVVLVSLAGAVAAGAGWWRAAVHAAQAEANAAAATQQRERAEEHLTVAREAVDRFYTDVYQKGLLNDPARAEEKRQLLAHALRFYERMLDRERADPALSGRAALTAGRVGWMQREVGRSEDALPVLRDGIALARVAYAAAPDDRAAHQQLANNVNLLWLALRELRRFDEADPLNEEAIALWADWVARHPDDRPARRNLGAMHANRAGGAFLRGDKAAARAGFAAAHAEFAELARRFPDDFVAQMDLAKTEFNLGFGQEPDLFVRWAESARRRRRDILTRWPDGVYGSLARLDLTKNCLELAGMYLEHARPADALPVAREAAAVAREYLTSDPSHLPSAANLFRATNMTAIATDMAGDPTAATRLFEELTPQAEALLAKDRRRFRADVAAALMDRAAHYHKRNQPDRAAADRDRCRPLVEEILAVMTATDPERPNWEKRQTALQGFEKGPSRPAR